MLRVIQRGEHRLNCRAVVAVIDGRWDSPWAVDRGVWRDVNGGFRGHTTLWLNLPCNDPNCSAYALVDANTLLDAVEQSLGAVSA